MDELGKRIERDTRVIKEKREQARVLAGLVKKLRDEADMMEVQLEQARRGHG